MAYKVKELEEISVKAIIEHELVFIDDLRAYIPCDMSTFYNHKLEKLESIKRVLYENKISQKVKLRKKWFQSDAPALQMGLYKLLSEKDEYNRLSNNPLTEEKDTETTTANKLTLANQATAQYLNITLAIQQFKILILRGGTRSSKSYSLAQIACDWLISGSIGKISTDDDFSIVMESLPALRDTVVKDIIEILDLRELDYKHHKTEKYFEIGKRRISYFSSDAISKMKRKSGFIWADEADMMQYEFFQQLISRSSVGRVFLAFNPSNPDIWINQKLEIERAQKKRDVKVLVSSYLNNPFLSDAQIEEIEYLMTVDPEYKQVYGKGEYGNLTGLVYPIWELFNELPQNRNFLEVITLDYGYVNDPMAIHHLFVDRNNREVYIFELMYSVKMEQEDVDRVLEPFMGLPIIVDGSAQETYNSICNSGHLAEKAKKGAGSIVGGINLVRKYKVKLHRTAKGVIRENKSYCYAKDKKTSLLTEQPLDKDNHAMDGIRYGITWYDNLYGWEQGK